MPNHAKMFQTRASNYTDLYATIQLYLNIYNGDSVNFPKPPTNSASLLPAKGGWKFYGNPEMEITVDNELSQIVRLY